MASIVLKFIVFNFETFTNIYKLPHFYLLIKCTSSLSAYAAGTHSLGYGARKPVFKVYDQVTQTHMMSRGLNIGIRRVCNRN